MLIVIESGSTKADWMIVNGDQRYQASTMGFNPYFHNEADVETAVRAVDKLVEIAHSVSDIYFYGAGCSQPELNEKIERGLQKLFTNASISVGHDLDACAFATYSGVPEIACILGTGSNSCYYDGEEVYEEIPALDFILGNEGGGTDFGRTLLSDYLYKRLPSQLHNELQDMGLDKPTIVENVYMSSSANVYIASFMPAILKHRELPYCQNLIKDGFKRFIEIHVRCYENYKNVEVNFVGSIAHLLSKELYEVCEEEGLNVGSVIRRPLDNLVQFHLNQSKEKVL
ncbi:MAG: ATPase [Crocinitomicaceae bacterium]